MSYTLKNKFQPYYIRNLVGFSEETGNIIINPDHNRFFYDEEGNEQTHNQNEVFSFDIHDNFNLSKINFGIPGDGYKPITALGVSKNGQIVLAYMEDDTLEYDGKNSLFLVVSENLRFADNVNGDLKLNENIIFPYTGPVSVIDGVPQGISLSGNGNTIVFLRWHVKNQSLVFVALNIDGTERFISDVIPLPNSSISKTTMVSDDGNTAVYQIGENLTIIKLDTGTILHNINIQTFMEQVKGDFDYKSCILSGDGKTFVVSSADSVYVIDVESLKITNTFILKSAWEDINMGISYNGEILVAYEGLPGMESDNINIWDIQKNKEVADSQTLSRPPRGRRYDDSLNINQVLISNDGRRVFIKDEDDNIYLWQAKEMKPTKSATAKEMLPKPSLETGKEGEPGDRSQDGGKKKNNKKRNSRKINKQSKKKISKKKKSKYGNVKPGQTVTLKNGACAKKMKNGQFRFVKKKSCRK